MVAKIIIKKLSMFIMRHQYNKCSYHTFFNFIDFKLTRKEDRWNVVHESVVRRSVSREYFPAHHIWSWDTWEKKKKINFILFFQFPPNFGSEKKRVILVVWYFIIGNCITLLLVSCILFESPVQCCLSGMDMEGNFTAGPTSMKCP